MVITPGGIVSSSQTLASQAGAQVLARGGSAIDAAIATNAVLGVVEPMMCGLGGDLFVIYYEAKTGKLHGLNASGWSGKNQTLETLRQRGLSAIPSTGIHTATVPGAVDGWWKIHQRFGKRPWAELFSPAIYYAREGFPVTEIIQFDWGHTVPKLAQDANAARQYLRNGQAPAVGDLWKLPELADAYTLLAKGGRDAFYKGPIRDAILQTSARLGGTLQASDFTEFQSEWVQPISTTYRGWTVYEIPPNGQGIAALMMLNLMEKLPLTPGNPTSARELHSKIEAQKLAYADLRKYVADPAHAKIPVAGMLSKAYAEQRAALVQPEQANCSDLPGQAEAFEKTGHTIYLSVIDREGNMASWIQSVSDLWGSGVVVDKFGFHLHDRANGFSSQPNHPNQLAARKRPFHTIIPGFMERGDEKIAFGIMRGSNQAQAHAQFVSYIADHGANIQAALEGPRFTRRETGGCSVLIESRVPSPDLDRLRSWGHLIDLRGNYSGLMGGGQAVLLNTKTGMHFGASSPRKDGAAIPEPDPYFAPALPSAPAAGNAAKSTRR